MLNGPLGGGERKWGGLAASQSMCASVAVYVCLCLCSVCVYVVGTMGVYVVGKDGESVNQCISLSVVSCELFVHMFMCVCLCRVSVKLVVSK